MQRFVIYKEEFPDECLIALCAEKSSSDWRTRPLSESVETLPLGSRCMLLSDYWNKDMVNHLKATKNISIVIVPGTPAYLAYSVAKEILGPWFDFTEPGSPASMAYAYWKTLPFEERRHWIAETHDAIPEELVRRGEWFRAKEQSMAEAVDRVAIKRGRFIMADLGMTRGIRATHDVLHRRPDIDCSLIHYLDHVDHRLIHCWSTKSKTPWALLILDDQFFRETLGCQTFGPPYQACKPGDLRGGADGFSFADVVERVTGV